MTTAPYLDRDVLVGGLKLHYQEWGDPANPALLMVHGFGVSGHMFDEFAQRMQDRYHLIAIDQRGHGDSDWSPAGDYTRDAFVNDIEGFRNALGLDRLILMGHSMGGLNCVSYTAAHPAHVSSLVLVDVGPEAAKEGVENIVRFTRGPDELDFDQFVEMAHRFNQRRTIENIRERMGHRLKQLDSGKWTWKFDERFRKGDASLKIGSDLNNDQTWQVFRSVKAPTLLVRGAESDVLTQEVADRCVREMSLARLVVVPGAGHSVPGDAPDEFTSAVGGFLDDVAGGRFGPAVEATLPPLGELVTANDRAARRRPGSLTLLLVGIGAAAAVTTIVVASNRSGRRRRAGTVTHTAATGVVGAMDEVGRRTRSHAHAVADAARPVVERASRKRRAGLIALRLSWKMVMLAPRLVMGSRRAPAPRARKFLPWRS